MVPHRVVALRAATMLLALAPALAAESSSNASVRTSTDGYVGLDSPAESSARVIVCVRRTSALSKHISCVDSEDRGTLPPAVAVSLAIMVIFLFTILICCIWHSGILRICKRRHGGSNYSLVATEEEEFASWSYDAEAVASTKPSDCLPCRWRWFDRLADHAKVLVVAIIAFGTITAAQTAAALAANSLALLGDCASMGVDTLTYIGNLYAEIGPQHGPEATQRRQLCASALSLSVLVGVTTAVVIDALGRLHSEQVAANGTGEAEEVQVNAHVVFGFAIGGLVLDCATFAAFHAWGLHSLAHGVEENAPNCTAELQEYGDSRERQQTDSADSVEELASGSRLNMCSAFLHVAADCLRSTTTLGEALLIWFGGFDSERTDAIASLIVSSTILAGCLCAFCAWTRQAMRFYCAQPNKQVGVELGHLGGK